MVYVQAELCSKKDQAKLNPGLLWKLRQWKSLLNHSVGAYDAGRSLNHHLLALCSGQDA